MATAELNLINKVELKFALANDSKLEPLVNVFLAPLLLKYASPHDTVRLKVDDVRKHLDSRISSSNLNVPFEALAKQLSTVDSPRIAEVDLMYLRYQATILNDKTSQDKIKSFAKELIACIRARQKLIDYVLPILLQVLKYWVPGHGQTIGSESANKTRHELGLVTEDGSSIEGLLALKLQNILISNTAESEISNNEHPLDRSISKVVILESAVSFITAGLLSEKKSYLPLFIAAYNPLLGRLSDQPMLQLNTLKPDYEDPEVVEYLYGLLLSDNYAITMPRFETRCVQFLAKSKHAANYRPRELIEKRFSHNVTLYANFVRNVATNSTNEVISEIAPQVIQIFKDFITSNKSTSVGGTNRVALDDSRGVSYEVIGMISARSGKIDLDVVYFLFNGLESEPPSIKSNIQRGLSDIIPHLTEEAFTNIFPLLLKKAYDPASNQAIKYMAVTAANRLTSFYDMRGRLICLICVATENQPNVIEEAKRGLDPYSFSLLRSDDESPMGPSCGPTNLLDLISEFTASINGDNSVTGYKSGVSGFPDEVYRAICSFLEQLCVIDAVKDKNTGLELIDDKWSMKITAAISYDEKTRLFVRQYFDGNTQSCRQYLDFLWQGVKQNKSDLASVEENWIRALCLSPNSVISQLADQTHEVLKLLPQRYSLASLKVLANTLSIFAISDDHSKVEPLIETLLTGTEQDGVSLKQSGYILSLGYLLSNLSLASRIDGLSSQLVQDVINVIIDKIINGDEASIEAFGLICLGGVPLADKEVYTKVQTKLVSTIKQNNEQALLALGALAMIGDEQQRKSCINAIFDLSDSKSPDFLLSSGEALSLATCGWRSSVAQRYIGGGVGEGSSHVASGPINDILGHTLDQVLEKSKSTKPSLRRFTCIWILSLIQFCGQEPEVKSRLKSIHLTLMKYIGDRDEFIQDAASRGLNIVYELGDSEIRDSLVHSLMSSFTSDAKQVVNAGTVSEDTELFDRGMLNTGDGSISTYKEVLNLAVDVGNPALVYNFMSLARNSSLWASRKGAAFGLGGLLAKADINSLYANKSGFFKTLIPKLYRYRFDPNPSVQESMKMIWDVLVSDHLKQVKELRMVILDELLKSMTDREWRVRQASTLALTNLLHSMEFEAYLDKMEEIWALCFRILDDIKSSVRDAGMVLAKSLASDSVSKIDTSRGVSETQATKILSILIPFLTGKAGLQSEAEDIQAFALQTLIKLTKVSGKPLEPFIPQLVEEFIELLSTLEPQSMNYLALNADKYGLTADAIDASRMASLGGSRMMDAIESMIEQLTLEMTKSLVPRMSSVVKKSVGLPSKLGASRVLAALALRNLNTLRDTPEADSLLKTSISQLSDRNDTVAQSFAVSCGYLCRIARKQAILDYASRLRNLYFESTNEKAKIIAGTGLGGISSYASDRFLAFAVEFLPFAFIASHDSDKTPRELFQRVWNDNTAGKGAIKLYLNDILELANHNLGSQQWGIRQVCAISIAEVSVDSKDETFDALYDSFIKSLAGRSWNGKEKVLDSFVDFVIDHKDLVLQSENASKLQEIRKVITVEVKRKTMEYQLPALVSFGKFIGSFPSEESYTLLFEISNRYVGTVTNESDSEDDDGDVSMKDSALSSQGSIAKEERRVTVLSALAQSMVWNSSAYLEQMTVIITEYFIRFLEAKDEPIATTWRTKIGLLESLIMLKDLDASLVDVASKLWTVIVETCGKDLNSERVRVQTAKLAGSLIKIESLKTKVQSDVNQLLEFEKSSLVIAELRRCQGDT